MDRQDPKLAFTPGGWRRFTTQVKAGRRVARGVRFPRGPPGFQTLLALPLRVLARVASGP